MSMPTAEPIAPVPARGSSTTVLVGRAFSSPIGTLELVASEAGLVAVLWPQERPGRAALGPVIEGEHAVLLETAGQLDAYFAGRLRAFDVPLDMRGTAFQKTVWTALREIPFGETRSYRDIAEAIGLPTACRAVGAANGRNPLSIVVPCHRVIGSGGSLTGFAGGLEAKRHLLALEAGTGRPL